MTGCLKPKRIKRRLALPSKFTSYLFAEKLCSIHRGSKDTVGRSKVTEIGRPSELTELTPHLYFTVTTLCHYFCM